MNKYSGIDKTYISLDAIEKMYRCDQYKELYRIVCEDIKRGHIQPVKNSRLNGKNPSLHEKYRIIRKLEDNSEFIDELTYHMWEGFDISYYKTHMDKYKEHRKYISMLNEFILKNRDKLNTSISMNERSFQIWGREKFLQKEEGKTILKNLGISCEFLNYYDTSEPLAYYSVSKEVPQKLLIIENKDTYYTMRRFLIERGGKILGEDIGTIIYGGGKNICKTFKDFKISVEEYVCNKENQILYFGDLDYEGIIIYESLFNVNGGIYPISPFVAAYEKMMDKVEESSVCLPETKTGQNRNIGIEFMSKFSCKSQNAIKNILEKNLYIPQEIININDL
ncbi:hypothetical protein SAMN02745248_00349 [Hathewaya proteolytica DSM 3090]|uniref:Wadjet protein JetD C-terminal domain-containing protein n=1 Tax=Hathewaya proteolytica DSM 3090 TaxID=1121331 RepID=A0A1M6K6A7_9CLOT|nr:Wadjet anti-phage system protein JetD domain-containing protein [Hathewaya proteolytica]SHJ54427.1 hypothetical protein SAMN02745248_00349 [Hathewaya proteolytica DSM 3090]